jgi:truncated hemoglobin YjbI
MDEILGYLAQFGSFARQGELLCTQGLTFLLKNRDGERALRELVSTNTGHLVATELKWRAESRQTDRGRPDIEGADPNGRAIVKIEAKLGASLGDGQLESYLAALSAGGAPGVLVVIVPRARRGEIVERIRPMLHLEGAGPWRFRSGLFETPMAVVSWEDVFEALVTVPCDEFRDNLNQLRAMYRVLNGDDMEPLTSDEEILQWRERAAWWETVVELVTRRLTPPGERVLPIGSEEGSNPYRRRYVCRRIAEVESCYSVGTRDPFQNHRTPIWLRFNKTTGHFKEITSRLERSALGAAVVRSEGHLWFPLDVPLNSERETMIGALVAQVQRIMAVAYETIDTSLYARAGGFDAILHLCRRWHELCLRDPVAAHPFEHDLHPQHDERLAAYMAQALGGPALYTGGYGDESAVQRIHAGNGVHEELDEACLALFDRALTDVGMTGDVAAKISTYFRAATEAQRVYSDPDAVVPDGLPFNYAT